MATLKGFQKSQNVSTILKSQYISKNVSTILKFPCTSIKIR